MSKHDTTLSANIQLLNEFDRPIPAYDDGRGFLWVFRDSMGVVGVIRAQSFVDAYGIAEDEFMPEAQEATWDEIAKECGVANPDDLMDDVCFQEGYGFRPNGANASDVHKHGIYQRDLNGEALDELTPELMKRLRLTIKLA